MCTGAIINARIKRVVYGASDEAAGCCGSVANLTAMPFAHTVYLTKGVLEEECQQVLSDFFKNMRKKENEKLSQTDCTSHQDDAL